MNVLNRFEECLLDVRAATAAPPVTTTEHHDRLVTWNDELETLLQKSTPEEQMETLVQPTKQDLATVNNNSDSLLEFMKRGQRVSQRLLNTLLYTLEGGEPTDGKAENVGGDAGDSSSSSLSNSHRALDEHAKRLQSEWESIAPTDNEKDDITSICLSKADLQPHLTEVMRACKNWLRWYLQIFEPATAGFSATSLPPEVTDAADWIPCFKSKPFLQLYLTLLEAFCCLPPDNEKREEAARHVSQVFFYATFCPVAGSDQELIQTYDDLCMGGRGYGDNGKTCAPLFDRFLRLLISAQTAPLALSLVRNVHNGLVSFPKAGTYFQKTNVQPSPCAQRNDIIAPWLKTTSSDPPSSLASSSSYEYKPVLIAILQWSISDHSSEQLLPFPGPKGDLRSELVVELLRTFYALRMGMQITHPSTATSDDQKTLSETVVQLLQLKHHQDKQNHDNDQHQQQKPSMKYHGVCVDERSSECQQAAVNLLMDSNPSFAQHLVEQNAVESLILLLRYHVGEMVGPEEEKGAFYASSFNDAGYAASNQAAAAVTPILVVLLNYCNANKEFRTIIKTSVFPPSQEAHFHDLVQQESMQQNNNSTAATPMAPDVPKNMHPLDAPRGTLRARLIRLLTWPQGHIKRFAGELLWVLCGSKSHEFVHRVGMGNALPVLHNKSVVQLPAQMRGS